MKLCRILCASVGLAFASSASAQDVVSQLGTFSEQVAPVPMQAADQASPLSLFLQQAAPLAQPSMPSGMTPPSIPVVASTGTGPSWQPIPAVPATGTGPSFEVPVLEPLAAVPAAPPGAMPTPPPSGFLARPKGLLTVKSMKVASPDPEGSKLFFGAAGEFSMGTDSAGNFIVQEASAPAPLLSMDSANTLYLGSARVEAQSLDAQGGISVRGVQQWQLVHAEDFSFGGSGWTRSEVTQCAGVYMLGGFCKFSKGEVNRTFHELPAHKQLRVVATYHFIDRWIGETGYMKLDVGMSDCPLTVWSERYAQQEAKNGISICGDTATPEGKFAAPIDVTVPHHKDFVTVSFGSTMDDADACDESWGVSSLEIYVRG